MADEPKMLVVQDGYTVGRICRVQRIRCDGSPSKTLRDLVNESITRMEERGELPREPLPSRSVGTSEGEPSEAPQTMGRGRKVIGSRA